MPVCSACRSRLYITKEAMAMLLQTQISTVRKVLKLVLLPSFDVRPAH
jgi:hypothetical protein